MLYLISPARLLRCTSVPRLTTSPVLAVVSNISDAGLRFKSPSIVVTVFPVSLTFPESTLAPSIYPISVPLFTDMLPMPLKSSVLASIDTSPVSKSIKNKSPTLNVPLESVEV